MMQAGICAGACMVLYWFSKLEIFIKPAKSNNDTCQKSVILPPG
jgi:hypothetical protein